MIVSANSDGLHDMTGNVWQCARDWHAPGHLPEAADGRGGQPLELARRLGGPAGPSVVIKGGSWLCAPNFCARYQPAARQAQEVGLGVNHVGFRTVLRER